MEKKEIDHPSGMEEVCCSSTLCHDALLDRWEVAMDKWVRGDQFFYRVASLPCSLFVTFCSRSCSVCLLVCLRIYTRHGPPRNKLSHRGNETISPFPSSLALVFMPGKQLHSHRESLGRERDAKPRTSEVNPPAS